MKNRKITLSVALAILVSSSVSIAQQGAKKKTATATEGGASTRVEPLRVIGGELHGRTVKGQVTQGVIATDFSLTIMKAEIVNGRLQLSGDFALGGARSQMSDRVTATIGGVMSNAENPWPSAREEKRSEVKDSKEKEKKAKIKAHSDKTKDMPRNCLIAFCTFYNFDNVKIKQNNYDETNDPDNDAFGY